MADSMEPMVVRLSDAGTFATARKRLENELRQGLLPLEHNDKTTGGEQ
jgi:hypothetical protein